MYNGHLRSRFRSYTLILFFTCLLAPSNTAGADEPLPRGAIARLGTHQFYQGPDAFAVLSPDGRFIASAGSTPSYYAGDHDPAYGRTVVIWNSATGERVRELQVEELVRRLRFSPDSKRLAVSQAYKFGHVAVFEVATGRRQIQFSESSDYPELVDFANDGKAVFLTKGHRATSVILWGLNEAKPLREWKAIEKPSEWLKERQYVCQMIPSPNGKFIASFVDERPDYSKVPPGVLVSFRGPDPQILIVSDAETEKPLYSKTLPRNSLNYFSFSPDSQHFAAGFETVSVFETSTGKETVSLEAKDARPVALSPDGKRAVISAGRAKEVWNLNTRKVEHQLLSGLVSVDYNSNMGQQFSADGKWALLATDSTLRLFDVTTGKERLSLGHRSEVTPRFSPDGTKLFTTCLELRRTWNVQPRIDSAPIEEVRRNKWEGKYTTMAQSADGQYFVDEVRVGETHQVRLCDTATGRVLKELKIDGWWGNVGVFSPDSSRFVLRRYQMRYAVDENGKKTGAVLGGRDPEVLRLYDTKTGTNTGDIDLTNGVSGVTPAYSPDARTIGWIDSANDVHIHDAVTGKLIRTLHSPDALPLSECNDGAILFSNDGQHLAVTTYKHVLFKRPDGLNSATLPNRVFHVASGREVSRFYCNPEKKGHALENACMAWSADGRLLAVAEVESPLIRLLDVATGQLKAEYRGHRDGVHGLAFSPDGKMLASGGEDGTTVLWDVPK